MADATGVTRVTASLTARGSSTREGWWVAVRAGESLAITARLSGPGSYGILAGPQPGTWLLNRSRSTTGTVNYVLPAAEKAGLWWIQVSCYGGACDAEVTVNPTTLPGGAVPLYRLTKTYRDLPAGTFIQRRAVLGGDAFSVTGTTILGADGITPWVARGANIGVNQAIGGNQWGDENKTPHIAEAVEWGWNTIRITTYVSDEVPWIASYGRQRAINETFSLASKYAAAGFAVVIAVMDITQGIMGSSTGRLAHIEDFAVQFGNRFKGNPRVWFNINEPSGPKDGPTFQAFHGRFYDALRSTGARNIYVADVMTNAQDGTWRGTAPRGFDPEVGPTFVQGRENIVMGYHTYGGLAENTDSQDTFDRKYGAYVDSMRAAGLAMLFGECGFEHGTENSTAGDARRKVRGFRSTLRLGAERDLGVLVWDGTFDIFSLKNTLSSNGYHGRPFWYQGAGGDLSVMGREFWDFCHPQVVAP